MVIRYILFLYMFELFNAGHSSKNHTTGLFTCTYEPVNKTAELKLVDDSKISNETQLNFLKRKESIVSFDIKGYQYSVFPNYRGNVTINYFQYSPYINISVTVKNADESQVIWLMEYSETIMGITTIQCSMSIYKPAAAVTCNYFCSDGIVIECSAMNIYPQAKCSIAINNDTLTRDDKWLDENFIYSHSAANHYDKSYNSNCSTVLSFSYTNSSHFTVTVTMYPNVTGNYSDKQYGVQNTLFINIEEANLAFGNCPETVTHGANVTCDCRAVGCGVDASSIRWINVRDSTVMNNGSNTLHFTSHVGTQEFNCTAIDNRTNVILTKTFKVTVINSSDETLINEKHGNGTQAYGTIPQTIDVKEDIVIETSTVHVIIICVLCFGLCLLLGKLLVMKSGISATLCYAGRNRNEYHRMSNVSNESTRSFCATEDIDNVDIYSIERTANDHYSTIRTSLIIINRKNQERCKQVQAGCDVTLQVRCEGSWLHEDPYAEIFEVGTHQVNPVTDVDRNITIDTATSIGSDPYATVEDTFPSLMLSNETSLAAPTMCLTRETVNNCLYTQVYKRVA